MGYFSKEKQSNEHYNLACILTLPPHQRKGYGRFIISLSYEISKREGKTGSPEKPLSDLGKLSYRAFWSCKLLSMLLDACQTGKRPGIAELSKESGIQIEDIISTLQHLGLIKSFHKQYVLAVTQEKVENSLQTYINKNFSKAFCKPECLLELV